MRWKIGEFEFDSLTRQISPSAGKPLGRKAAKLLVLLIQKHEEGETDYENDELFAEIWDTDKSAANKSLQVEVHKLRRKFGGARESYIANDPYHLAKTAVRIGDDTIVMGAQGTVDSGEIGQRPDSRSGASHDFTLIVDGMIINSVSEALVNDSETEGIRRMCCASYEHSLEDLAFAVVYAARIVTSKDFRPSLTTPNQPGHEVAARLREICEQRAYPSYITDGRLLRMGSATRDGIRADIQGLAKCVADRSCVHFFRDYMVREASKHLGIDDRLFQEDIDPDRCKFDVKKPYYTDRALQDALGTNATETLVSFLPKSPQNSKDRYAKTALREFATRNVLSLITIMWEGEEYAKETGARRMPHVLRATVMRQRSNDPAGTQHQELLRNFVVEHALIAALGQMRKETRHNLMAALLNLRDDPPFKQFREQLNKDNMMFVESDPKREKGARRVLHQLKTLTAPELVHPDRVHLAHGAALRISGSPTAPEYEREMSRVFPELRPNKA